MQTKDADTLWARGIAHAAIGYRAAGDVYRIIAPTVEVVVDASSVHGQFRVAIAIIHLDARASDGDRDLVWRNGVAGCMVPLPA